MRHWNVRLTLLGVVCLASIAFARPIRVPGDYANIREASAIARAGDSVIVATGTWLGDDNLNIALRDSVTLISEAGADSCVIDAENTGLARGVIVGDYCKVIGLTFTGFRSNTILDSTSNHVTIRDCIFRSSENAERNQSVAVKVALAIELKIDHCLFQELQSYLSGGALQITPSSTAFVTNSVFDQNSTARSGGAVMVNMNSVASFRNCLFTGNFAGNGTSGDGGAIACTQNSRTSLANCTLYGNAAPDGRGGAVNKGSNSNIYVTDCIFWNNAAIFGPQLCQTDSGAGAGGRINISYALVEPNGDAAYVGNWRGDHIIDDEPLFEANNGLWWGVNGYFLEPGSPAIDAGHCDASEDSLQVEFFSTRADGALDAGVVDLGYHYNPDDFRRIGFVYGTITDATNGLPIEGALVRSSRRYTATTNEDGQWWIEHRAGIADFSFVKPGYLPQSVQGIEISGADSILIDVNFRHSEFSPSVRGLDVLVPRDDTVEVEFDVHNTGNGTLSYTGRMVLPGNLERPQGELIDTASWGRSFIGYDLRGCCYVDGLFYVSACNLQWDGNLHRNQILIFDRSGVCIDSFPQPGNDQNGIRPLTWDGSSIWGISNDAMLYSLSRSGEVERQFQLPNAVYFNLMWDPDNQLLWVATISSNILAFDRDGNSANRSIRVSTLRKYGLFYRQDDPTQHTMWMLTRPTGNLNRIMKMHPATRDTQFVMDVRAAGGDYVSMGLQLADWDPSSITVMSILQRLNHQGGDQLGVWSLEPNHRWMLLPRLEGDLPAGESQHFWLGLASTGLPLGAKQASLLFQHDGFDRTAEIPITMRIITDEIRLPKLALSESRIDFGEVVRGTASYDTLTISNAGNDDLTLAALNGVGVGFRWPFYHRTVIPPGGALRVPINFILPDTVGPLNAPYLATGEIRFTILTPEQKNHTIPLFATVLPADGGHHWRVVSTDEYHSLCIERAMYLGARMPSGWEIGVFTPDGLLAGTGFWEGFRFSTPAYGDDSTTADLEGFRPEEIFLFRVCDAGSGLEYDADPEFTSGPEVWTSGGNSFLNLRVHDIRDQRIDFQRGWNLVSLNITPDDVQWTHPEGPDVIDLLYRVSTGDPPVNRVLMVKDSRGRFCSPDFGFNNIPYWNLREGYQVKVDTPVTASWEGQIISPRMLLDLPAGWSIVSYLPSFPLSASPPDFRVVASLIDNLIIAKDGSGRFLTPLRNFSNMERWRESLGYFVKLRRAETFVYPISRRIGRDEPDVVVVNPSHWVPPSPTDNSMSLLVGGLGGLSRSVSELAVFTGEGLCVGASTVTSIYNGWVGVAVWGDDPTTAERDGARPGDTLELRIWKGDQEFHASVDSNQVATYVPNDLSTIGVASVQEQAEWMPAEYQLYPPSPNPFNSTVAIQFHVPCESKVDLAVYNAIGREVVTLLSMSVTAGSHEVEWDGRSSIGLESPSGIYIITLRTSGGLLTRKAVLLK